MADKIRMLHEDLLMALGEVEAVLKHYGIGHWKATLVIRNPDRPGEWTIESADDVAAVGALLVQHAEDQPTFTERPCRWRGKTRNSTQTPQRWTSTTRQKKPLTTR